MHAAEYNDVGVGFLGFETEAQRIANIVRQILDLRDLIIVSQDYGIALLFQMQNLSRKIVSLLECNHQAEIISPPLALRNSVFDIPKTSSLSLYSLVLVVVLAPGHSKLNRDHIGKRIGAKGLFRF
jgi:hypothetical protein